MIFSESVIARFWGQVQKGDGCWNWIGTRSTMTRNGKKYIRYGNIKVNHKSWKAHRFSYVLHNGGIPDGMCICHKCDNVACVNPSHLFVGTQADNIKDRVKKGRTVIRPSHGEVNGMARLKEHQVIEILRNRTLPHKQLAAMYGIGREAIGKILRGERWKHVAA